jgi:GNAT superfamily N-acetyltransferase
MKWYDRVKLLGAVETARAVRRRAFATIGFARSSTYVLRRQLDAPCHEPPPVGALEVRSLDLASIATLPLWSSLFSQERIRTWTEELSLGVGLFRGDELCGCGWVHIGVPHSVPGLGVVRMESDEAWAGPLYVSRAHQHKALGKALIALLLREASRQGINSVLTGVNSRNLPSLCAFTRQGFRVVARVDQAKVLGVKYRRRILSLDTHRAVSNRIDLS